MNIVKDIEKLLFFCTKAVALMNFIVTVIFVALIAPGLFHLEIKEIVLAFFVFWFIVLVSIAILVDKKLEVLYFHIGFGIITLSIVFYITGEVVTTITPYLGIAFAGLALYAIKFRFDDGFLKFLKNQFRDFLVYFAISDLVVLGAIGLGGLLKWILG